MGPVIFDSNGIFDVLDTKRERRAASERAVQVEQSGERTRRISPRIG
ncbi:hypothetical protein ACFWRV_20880 [Streptomyces sp. NPDC058576]